MACSKGYVTTGASQPIIHLCVSTDSRDVYATLEGESTERWPFQGYVKFSLYRETLNADGWTLVTTLNGGRWENSSKANKNVTFNNIGQPGKVMRIVAEFYTNSNYTGKLSSSVSHLFER